MRSNWIRFFKRYRILFIGFLFLILFMAVGLQGLAALQSKLFAADASLLGTLRKLTGLFLAYGLAMAVVVLLIQSMQFRPSKKVVKAGQKIASEDMPILSGAITELSQGNLSRQLNFNLQYLKSSEESDLYEVANIFNAMSSNLKDAAQAFNNVTGTPCKRFFYVGADSFLEGRHCGEIMGKVLKGKGQVVISAESFSATNLDLRRRGFMNVIREKYPKIEILDFVEAKTGGDKAYHVAVEVLKKYPQLTGIYIADGSSPAQYSKALVEAGKGHSIKIVCHDLMDDTMRWVKEGIISATLSQNSFAQGYNPVIHMFNHLATGWKPPMPFMLTDLEEVNQENCNHYWSEEQGMLFSDMAREKMAKPLVERSQKPIRIAVLGRDDTAFWISILAGVKEAMKTLKDHNVSIDCFAPKEVHQINDITIEIYGPVIDSVIERKYDGLVTMAPQKAFVAYINKAVDAGIPVGLYNSDPVSLRGLIYTITDQAKHLMGLSENLASSTFQTSEATIQIRDAMANVASGTETQNTHIAQTGDALQNLLNTIDLVSRDTERSVKATEKTSQAVNAGTDAMYDTLKTMKIIEDSVSDTWSIVEELGKHSERIDTVVELINDIASRVNVLALNAAIEATKAGEFGQGFMVVAREIRSLAKNTSEATTEVANLIHSVQTAITRVEKVMTDGLDKMKQSASLTDHAVKSLGKIQDFVKLDKQRMKNIAEAMEKMQSTSRNVGTAMDNVASVSATNMSAISQVTALTKGMSDQLTAVSDLAQSLEAMARSEQQMLAKFILTDEL
jgi:methyl-accepting chemotaxis protein